MQLQEIYAKRIGRDIKGVIKVGQLEQAEIFQELDEYVVTKELNRHFDSFFDAYIKGINQSTDAMGVWISGFFGSGKSHFLKILSYILENQEVDGREAVSFFDSKIKDPILLANLKRAGQVPSDIVLFNIDSKSDYGTGSQKDAILKVFIKVFYEMQGFYGSKPWVADMESQLVKEGNYEKFKSIIQEKTGDLWENRRRRVLFDRDLIVNSLMEVRNCSKDSALEWFNNKDNNFTTSIGEFALAVKAYLEERGRNHHIVFLVDEIGQYIGDNTQMMLDLQTIVEELGAKCKGKAWVIVTSQEDIDSVTPKVKGRDFSKIQGRFNTRINLSSSNVDEVIKKRLLEKTAPAQDTLGLLYDESNAKLRNTISFASGTAEMKNFANKTDFIEIYPFIPYQFNLLQKVFSGIRKHGSSGKHLAEGERSLLSAFQESAQAYREQSIGTLVPFYTFYNSIETFLDGSIRRVIDQARENTQLHPEDLDVLKLLFMIKYVKEIQPKLENLATLMVTKIDEDKITLKGSIEKSLRRLVQETLIQKDGDEYTFLTDDEQDVNREIKNMLIDPSDVSAKLGEVIFEDIYPDKKYKYNSKYDFAFNQQIDDRPRGKQDGEMGIRMITPFFDHYSEYGEQEFKNLSFGGDKIIVKLPPDADFWYEMEEVLKIESYRTKTASISLPETIQGIIDNKSRELKTRKDRVKSLLITAITEADIYVNAQKVEIKSVQPVEKLNKAFQSMVESIYTKLNYIKKFVLVNSDLWQILTENDHQIKLVEDESNQLALDELNNYIGRNHDRNVRVTMKMVLDYFKAAPYGWKEIDIAAQVAKLFKLQEVKLQYGAEYLDITDKEIPNYLTKKTEVEKLVIIKRVLVSAELLLKARNIGRNVFDHGALPQDEDSLMKGLKDIMVKEMGEIKGIISRYQHGQYPGKHALEVCLMLLKKLSEIKVALEFYNTLIETEEEISQVTQDVKKVKGFFKNQLPHFEKAVKMLEIYKDNETYVLDKEINETVAQVKSIVENSNPYAEIIQLPALVAKFNDRFVLLLQEKCQPIKVQIQADYAQVKDELGKFELDISFQERIKKPFETLLDRIDSVNNFYKAIAMKTESEILKLRSFEMISDETKPIDPPPTPNPNPNLGPGGTVIPPVIEPPSRFTQHLQITELFRSAPLITTEADVDALTSELGNKLKSYIRANKNVRLV
ncbi:BREX system P-loop protein BrxC [Desulfosporosinus sp. SB140]|uniref:BREX system P-loop protein BrxC n=1 Tax=Desulfosporosinus paludis TaxID=3115649 RepID=UPI00388E4A39